MKLFYHKARALSIVNISLRHKASKPNIENFTYFANNLFTSLRYKSRERENYGKEKIKAAPNDERERNAPTAPFRPIIGVSHPGVEKPAEGVGENIKHPLAKKKNEPTHRKADDRRHKCGVSEGNVV
jgi:hypothetical protein